MVGLAIYWLSSSTNRCVSLQLHEPTICATSHIPLHKVIISIFQFSLLSMPVWVQSCESLCSFALARWEQTLHKLIFSSSNIISGVLIKWRAATWSEQRERATHRAGCITPPRALPRDYRPKFHSAMNKSFNANKAICRTQIIIRRGCVRTSASSRDVACILNCSCTCTINTRWLVHSLFALRVSERESRQVYSRSKRGMHSNGRHIPFIC